METKCKVNCYWKEDGTRVRSHTRGLKHRVRHQKHNGISFGRKIVIFGCAVLFISTWYMCWVNNQPKAQTTVEAEEVAPSPLTKEQGFTQVAPRDTLERERVETVEELIERYFGTDTKVALAIAMAESGLNPTALGDTNTKYPSAGLFQIRLLPERGITKEQMFNSEENVRYAKLLHDKYGWSCWTVYKNGSYKKYL